MTKQHFVKTYYPYAKQAESQTGIPALFILAQAALETGYGKSAPGNMMFGVKDTDGVNGNEQLITTTEYLKNPNAKFPQIISKVFLPAKNLYKYIVKTWFRKYNSPKDSFVDHGKFLLGNKRYQHIPKACNGDWQCWCKEVHKAGYATGPNYSTTLIKIGKELERYI